MRQGRSDVSAKANPFSELKTETPAAGHIQSVGMSDAGDGTAPQAIVMPKTRISG